MTEVGGTYSIKYKTTMTIIIVVVIVPHRRPGPSSSVCIACVHFWVLAIICGLWWVVVVGCGSFFGGSGHFCVLAVICVCFGGFVIVSGQS